MGEASFLAVLVGGLFPGRALAGSGPHELVGIFVARDRGVGRYPPNGHLVVSRVAVIREQNSEAATAKCCPGPRVSVLFGANGGSRPSMDDLAKGHILGSIKFYPHFSHQLSNEYCWHHRLIYV